MGEISHIDHYEKYNHRKSKSNYKEHKWRRNNKELSHLMKYWNNPKISRPIQCIKIITPNLWDNERVNEHLEVINSMKSAFTKLEQQCTNTQQRNHVDQTLNKLYILEKRLKELTKDCKSIKQKGQSLKNQNEHSS